MVEELSMTILLNGVAKRIPEGTSVARLVEDLGLDAARLAIELDRNILPRDKWSTTVLSEGSSVEIVHFVGGGCGGGA